MLVSSISRLCKRYGDNKRPVVCPFRNIQVHLKCNCLSYSCMEVQIVIFCIVVITTFTVVNSSKYVFQFTSINNCQLFKSFNDMEYSSNSSSESISISETTKTPYSSIYYFFNDLLSDNNDNRITIINSKSCERNHLSNFSLYTNHAY